MEEERTGVKKEKKVIIELKMQPQLIFIIN
jgi:hypothetical protein